MGWFSSGVGKFLVWSKYSISLWVAEEKEEEDDLESSSTPGFKPFVKKAVYVLFLSFLALGGAIVGGVVGGIKGYSMPIGFLRGAAIGAMAATISLIQLLEFIAHGEPFSKFGFLCSLFDGKNFNQWVNPAVLKAYQWMMEPVENNMISFDEDIDQYYHLDYDIDGKETSTGLSDDYIDMLPKYKLINYNLILMLGTDNDGSSTQATSGTCPICLENLREGEFARKLPRCEHSFHVECIDQWLRKCGSCPLCRQQLMSN